MLYENIKQLRKAKGLSQEELAIKLNVVRQTVSKWENGFIRSGLKHAYFIGRRIRRFGQ